ncbi:MULTISPECIES: propionyl-CoA synthetase [Micrococcaceae]|nr:propionyl-CoA synthetase [Arthrobacter sp. Soil761]
MTGELNAAYDALDRHVEASNGERVDSYSDGERGDTYTYAQVTRI